LHDGFIKNGGINLKFLKTIRVAELKELLDQVPRPNFKEEIIPLEKCFNRTISRDIKSNINVPHFRKSRMDGYAVRAEDTFGAEEDNPISIELIEIIQAGDEPKKKLGKGQCAYVATGAALPENADSVVIVEFTERQGNKIEIYKAVAPGTNVVNIGHDVKMGDVTCKKGRLIDLPTMGILASCGINEVPVYKKPVVALFSTGNELITQDMTILPIGKIYDINSIVLKQAIENTGAIMNYLGIVRDSFDDLKQKMDLALTQSDIVILSGGTSKGEGDLGPKVLKEYTDIEIMVHGVRIKPGKPLIFAKLKEKIIFILPGFPTSALSCFYIFIDDFLRKFSGFPLRKKFSEKIEVGERIYSSLGRYEIKAIKIKEEEGVKKIYPIKTGSEAISTLFQADGYIEIEELEEIIEKGDIREVHSF
ncbi:MAG: molybdopterin molybdotransferase MoeA, partial [Promethearchaeota archaeon]